MGRVSSLASSFDLKGHLTPLRSPLRGGAWGVRKNKWGDRSNSLLKKGAWKASVSDHPTAKTMALINISWTMC